MQRLFPKEVSGREISSSGMQLVSHPPWLLRPPPGKDRAWNGALTPFSCQQGVHENPPLPSAGVRDAGGIRASAGDRGKDWRDEGRESKGKQRGECREENGSVN